MTDRHDEDCNPTDNEHFQQVLARGTASGLNRRQLIRGGLGLAALSSVPFLSACGGSDEPGRVPELHARSQAIEEELMAALERWEVLGAR